jgi:hypothetical protein
LLSKDLRVNQDFNSQSGNSFGNVGVYSLTFSDTLGNMKCGSWASLLACTFVSPYFGREPKVKVMTNLVSGNIMTNNK